MAAAEALKLLLTKDRHIRRSRASGLTLIELYIIAALAALGTYLVTGRLRPRDRLATVFLAALLALTLSAVLARTLGEKVEIRRTVGHHLL